MSYHGTFSLLHHCLQQLTGGVELFTYQGKSALKVFNAVTLTLGKENVNVEVLKFLFFCFPCVYSHTVPRCLSSCPMRPFKDICFYCSGLPMLWMTCTLMLFWPSSYKSNQILQQFSVCLHMLIYHRLLLITLGVAHPVRLSHWSSEGYWLYTCVTFTYHLSPCSSMVRASHWSSEGYRLYTYVTFIHHLSPYSSMVRASHWSSEGYRLYTCVTFTHHLSPCSSMVRASHRSSGYKLYTYANFTHHLSPCTVAQ